MREAFVRSSMVVALSIIAAGPASAQATIALPDSSQSTTLTANVSEQARITVPASVMFNVTNTAAITNAAAAVTVTNITLASATKQLQISVVAGNLSFTPSVAGGTTWTSSDVSWDAVAFSNAGVGTAGALAGVATYNIVQTCAVAVTDCSTANLPFHLAAKPTVNYAGSHTLTMTWKFASIGA
jgi:hypothetical protein